MNPTPTISEAARRADNNPLDQKTAFKMSAAFLTLPLHRKIEIAKSVGAPANTDLSDLEMCKGVFKWVVDNNRTDDLMTALGVQSALDSAHPAPKEGETPETDAIRDAYLDSFPAGHEERWRNAAEKLLEHARYLELRLSEAKLEIDLARNAEQILSSDYSNLSKECDTLRSQLKTANELLDLVQSSIGDDWAKEAVRTHLNQQSK